MFKSTYLRLFKKAKVQTVGVITKEQQAKADRAFRKKKEIVC